MQITLSRVCGSVEIIELKLGAVKFRESTHGHELWKRAMSWGDLFCNYELYRVGIYSIVCWPRWVITQRKFISCCKLRWNTGK